MKGLQRPQARAELILELNSICVIIIVRSIQKAKQSFCWACFRGNSFTGLSQERKGGRAGSWRGREAEGRRARRKSREEKASRGGMVEARKAGWKW